MQCTMFGMDPDLKYDALSGDRVIILKDEDRFSHVLCLFSLYIMCSLIDSFFVFVAGGGAEAQLQRG